MQTIEQISVHSHIDASVERKSVLLHILSIILLHTMFAMPKYVELFASIGENQTWPSAIIALIVGALMIPFLLGWAFIRLYPIVLHRVQLMFGGSATENEIRVGFAWSVLWGYISITIVWLSLFFISILNAAISDWLSIFFILLATFVVISGFLVHICMMAMVFRLPFWSTTFALAVGACIPGSLLYFAFVSLHQMARFVGYGL